MCEQCDGMQGGWKRHGGPCSVVTLSITPLPVAFSPRPSLSLCPTPHLRHSYLTQSLSPSPTPHLSRAFSHPCPSLCLPPHLSRAFSFARFSPPDTHDPTTQWKRLSSTAKTSAIWEASSRVGATTTAYVPSASEGERDQGRCVERTN